MAYAIGGISGCHINPAVILVMLVAGKIQSTEAIGHSVVQCIGAIVVAAVLWVIAQDLDGSSLAVCSLGQEGYVTHLPQSILVLLVLSLN